MILDVLESPDIALERRTFCFARVLQIKITISPSIHCAAPCGHYIAPRPAVLVTLRRALRRLKFKGGRKARPRTDWDCGLQSRLWLGLGLRSPAEGRDWLGLGLRSLGRRPGLARTGTMVLGRRPGLRLKSIK